jgi:hypothetical protein
VPKSEIGKARALVARFETGLRAQRKQKGGKGRCGLLQSKAGKQAAAGVRATGQTQNVTDRFTDLAIGTYGRPVSDT